MNTKKLEARAFRLNSTLSTLANRVKKDPDTVEQIYIEREIAKARKGVHQLVVQALDYKYGEGEVASWFARSADFKTPYPRVTPRTIRGLVEVSLVPNVPFHKPLSSSNLLHVAEDTYGHLVEVGANMDDWKQLRPNGSHATRYLLKLTGVKPQKDSLRLFISYELAVALSKALAIEPYRVGA